MFANKDDIVNCYNYYIYYQVEPGRVLHYQLHNMILTLSTRFKKTTQFARLNLFLEQIRLLAISQNKIIQILVKIVTIYKKILNKFAAQTWPRNNIDEI